MISFIYFFCFSLVYSPKSSCSFLEWSCSSSFAHNWVFEQSGCKDCSLGKGPLKAYLYWVTREQSSFEWFRDVMKEISNSDQKQVIVQKPKISTIIFFSGSHIMMNRFKLNASNPFFNENINLTILITLSLYLWLSFSVRSRSTKFPDQSMSRGWCKINFDQCYSSSVSCQTWHWHHLQNSSKHSTSSFLPNMLVIEPTEK